MKPLTVVVALVCSLIFATPGLAERTSTRLTPANVDKQPVAFTIKVERREDNMYGEHLLFHVTVKPKSDRVPLLPNRVAHLSVFDSAAFVSVSELRPTTRGNELTYSFRVAPKYAEKSTFMFDETTADEMAGAYYWFYLKDFPEPK